MKTKLLPIVLLIISLAVLISTTRITSAQNDFLAIAGQVKHVDTSKLPKELTVNLITINESGEQSKQSTIALDGHYMFFINFNEKNVYFVETIFQDIKYVSDYYNYVANSNRKINININIYDKSTELPEIENIVTKFTLSKIDYAKKEITFIREDIVRNSKEWTYFFDDQSTPTYKMQLLKNTNNARGNLGSGLFIQREHYLDITMPMLPGINTISSIHVVNLSDQNTYNFIYKSGYDTSILEVIVPVRFSKEITPINQFVQKGEQLLEKERMLIFQAENIAKGTPANLLIDEFFIEKFFFLAQNYFFSVLSLIIFS